MILPVIGLLVIGYLVAPIVVVIATSFTETAYPVFPPRGFTLKWFAQVLSSPELLDAAKRSALLATLSTCIATVLGTLAGLALYRYRFRGQAIVTNAMLSPILFPTIVLGLALLVFLACLLITSTHSSTVGMIW